MRIDWPEDDYIPACSCGRDHPDDEEPDVPWWWWIFVLTAVATGFIVTALVVSGH
jgi:hypothetical protein